ncbi:MAG: hypothetical protein AAFP19_21080 [Bacteroidota bacterium]
MKNTILFLTTACLLLINSLVVGQNKTTLQELSLQHQMELLPPEMAGLLNQMMEEANLFFNEALAMGMNGQLSDSATYTVDVFVEVVLVNDYMPSNLEASIFNTTAYNNNYPVVDNSEYMLAYFDPFNTSAFSQYASLDTNNRELFTLEACPSMRCLGSNAIRWFELDNQGWEGDEAPKPSIKVSSIGEWHFNIGPDEDSRYFIPILD